MIRWEFNNWMSYRNNKRDFFKKQLIWMILIYHVHYYFYQCLNKYLHKHLLTSLAYINAFELKEITRLYLCQTLQTCTHQSSLCIPLSPEAHFPLPPIYPSLHTRPPCLASGPAGYWIHIMLMACAALQWRGQ